MIGSIEKANKSNSRITVIKDRTVEIFANLFIENVIPGSVIRTDMYPSYPHAGALAGCLHQITIHAHGFINEVGIHTNTIENLWNHFKNVLRTKRGVMYKNMYISSGIYCFEKLPTEKKY